MRKPHPLRAHAAEDPPLGDPVLAGVALRDDDAAVLALAAELSAAVRAPLTLLHAYPFQPLIAIPPPEWAQELADDAAREVSALAARWGARSLSRPSPSPVRALHEAAEELGAWAIVVGSSHRGPAGRVLPGGVGERLLHAAPCVVVIAPRDYVRPVDGLRRIGVASAGGPGAVALRAQAEQLAHATDGELTTLSIAGDDVAAALAAASADLDALLTGSPSHGAFPSLLLGGVARALAHSARCPLFVIPSPRS